MRAKFSLPQANLVLASASTTRKLMLENAGIVFTMRPAKIDEVALRQAAVSAEMNSEDVAVLLADMKAKQVANEISTETEAGSKSVFVLGSDQLLVCDNDIFGKPKDATSAAKQLAQLAGKTHQLVTAAVIYHNGTRIWHHVESPEITLRGLDDKFISGYLAATGDAALNAPGSYQIEGYGAHLIAAITGCSYSVLGMPLLEILGFLRNHGLALEQTA